ncbi:hypothetical protein PGTUg99_030276 [Puccinia graminis f. sp. tritici]|uniref:Required for respiratory growth protein 7, mitochondrial n=1 Tax=Puccinia graminis f. sp. tritici TaxID=56615 RepID=A0A5B0P5E9_PUCGR|nr:hypothetical protein PGTUg99_030276 [Puccinia graminis f. sp. tritici]
MKPHSFQQKIAALRSSSAQVFLARPSKPKLIDPAVSIEKRSRNLTITPTSGQDAIAKPTPTTEINTENLSEKHAELQRRKNYNLIGNLYEKHSIKCMKEVLLMKDLVHVGKRGSQDGGIDIRGWLYSNHRTAIQAQPQDRPVEADKPNQAQQSEDADHDKQERRFIRAIAQCKCARVELKIVRELEGLVASSSTYNNPLDSKPTIGLLFASRGFTSASLTRAERSPFPLVLVSLDLPPTFLSLSDVESEGVDQMNHRCKISHCYPNPVAVRLIHPFEFIRVSKLTSDGLPAEQSWILVNRTINKL